jgi:hypothetical protein
MAVAAATTPITPHSGGKTSETGVGLVVSDLEVTHPAGRRHGGCGGRGSRRFDLIEPIRHRLRLDLEPRRPAGVNLQTLRYYERRGCSPKCSPPATCDQTVHGPPLNTHCTTLEGPATLRISNQRS